MGIYLRISSYMYSNKLLHYSKVQQLQIRKKVKMDNYIMNPNIKTKLDIVNLNRQINAIKIKSKKKGNSKLRNEIKVRTK